MDPLNSKLLGYSNAGEPLVHAYVQDEKTLSTVPVTFPVSAIDAVLGTNVKTSVLVLRSGMRISVALGYEELERRIYGVKDIKDDIEDELDLRSVTTAPKAEAPLSKQTELAPAQKTVAGSDLEIFATLRKMGSQETTDFTFREDAIASLEKLPSHTFSESIRISFKNAATKGPFGTGEALLDMPLARFETLVADAKRGRQRLLDISISPEKKVRKPGYGRI